MCLNAVSHNISQIPYLVIAECREEQFECTPGTCIPGVQWCDGTVDCPDGTDEPANCSMCHMHVYKQQNTTHCVGLFGIVPPQGYDA